MRVDQTFYNIQYHIPQACFKSHNLVDLSQA